MRELISLLQTQKSNLHQKGEISNTYTDTKEVRKKNRFDFKSKRTRDRRSKGSHVQREKNKEEEKVRGARVFMTCTLRLSKRRSKFSGEWEIDAGKIPGVEKKVFVSVGPVLGYPRIFGWAGKTHRTQCYMMRACV